jgi:tetratricopeptide (TPR) repeat protein
LSGRRVFKVLAWAAAACVALLVLILLWGYADRSWLAPRRSARILDTLNERSQTLDQQLAIIDRALSADPRNGQAWYLRARKLTEQKRYEYAATHWATLDHWPGLQGKLPGARTDLGMCLLFSGRPVEAISCFQETILRQPDHVSSRVDLAAAYADLGMAQKVRDELIMLDKLQADWRERYLSVPEWPDERKAIIDKLKPYLGATTQSAAGQSVDTGSLLPQRIARLRSGKM